MKQEDLETILSAVYTVNNHAKNVRNPQYLYFLKRETLTRLIEIKYAEKVGLYFNSKAKPFKRPSLLIQSLNFYFHLPPHKEDIQLLPHLDNHNPYYKNPKRHINLKQSKKILEQFVGQDKMSKFESKRHQMKKVNYYYL